MRTVNGKEYTYTSDELVLEDDEKGDAKITSQGILLGGQPISCLPPSRPPDAARYTDGSLFLPPTQVESTRPTRSAPHIGRIPRRFTVRVTTSCRDHSPSYADRLGLSLTVLSIDAARTCGYRDSLYFFRRNKELVKLTLAGVEKEHLIDIGRLSTTLKTRSVTMIAARNCFKLQGAKMLKSQPLQP